MIGRKTELEKLQSALEKDRAQLIAVYGRRRVGKTFLVNEFFGNRFSFKHTAVSPVDERTNTRKKGLMKIQLQEFFYSLKSAGLSPDEPAPTDWFGAFHLLEGLLERKDDGSTQVVFIDELPWMDTPKANFLPAFEHFCNDWCLARRNLKLVVCGSATSWILDKLIGNKGGLYGRVTMPIYISPFTLYECREFFRADGFRYDDYDICKAYMAFGGIPYYLNQFRKGLSIAQNIDALLFEEDAPLREEFDRLFTSQFNNPDELKRIVVTLSGKRSGYTRDELIKKGKISSGGTLSDNLSALQKSKLVISYTGFGTNERKYKLVDPFCSFFLKHVKEARGNGSFWQGYERSSAALSWMGNAFEDLCFNHVRQIKHALGIEGVITKESPWFVKADGPANGTQVDLIIDRDDRFVSVCEMKFTQGEFEIKKGYNTKLLERMQRVQEQIGRKSIHSVLVTTYGLVRNEYSSRFDSVVTMEDILQK